MSRHLVREIVRQLRESGAAGAVAALLVLVATLLAGGVLAVRAWILEELFALGRPATVTAALPGGRATEPILEELRRHFPTAVATVLSPPEVRAELASWFPELAAAFAGVPEEQFPALLVAEVPRREEAAAAAWVSQRVEGGVAVSSRVWREPLQRALAGLVAGAAVVSAILLAGCIVVVLLVVRLLVLAHADEIEIMRLIGAREREVRIPYVVSGATLAGAGSLLGVALLLLAHRLPGLAMAPHPPSEMLVGLALAGPTAGVLGALLGLAALPREP